MADVDFTVKMIDEITGPVRAVIAGLGGMTGKLAATQSAADTMSSAMRRVQNAMVLLQDAKAGGTLDDVTAALRRVDSAIGAMEDVRIDLTPEAAAQVAKLKSLSAAENQTIAAHRAAAAAAQSEAAALAAEQTAAQGTVSVLDRLKGGLSKLIGSESAASAIGNVLASGFQRIVSWAAQAAMAVLRLAANLAIAFGKAVIEGAMFGEQLAFALTRFLGSSGAARSEMSKLMKLANELGIDFTKAAQVFKDFISAGASPELARNMVRMRADMEALASSDQDVERIGEAFKQLQKAMATGRLETEGFNTILDQLPVNKMQIMQKLAPKLGKSLEEMMKMDITKMPVDKLIEAMQEAMLEATKTGKLGEVAIKKQTETLGGMWNAVKARARNALIDIGTRLLPSIKQALQPVVMGFIQWMQGPGGERAIVAITNGLKVLASVLLGFGKGFWEGIKPGAEALARLAEALANLGGTQAKGATSTMQMFGRIVGALAIPIMATVAAIGIFLAGVFAPIVAIASWADLIMTHGWAALAALETFGENALAWLMSLPTMLLAGATLIGGSIISGILSGLFGGAGTIVAALVGIATNALNAAKAALGIGSPSKVFEGVGFNVAEGMAQGITGGQPAIAAAAGGMVSPSAVQGGRGASSQTNNNRVTVPMTINAAADPAATAAAVRQVLMDELSGAFESIALEIGVVGSPA